MGWRLQGSAKRYAPLLAASFDPWRANELSCQAHRFGSCNAVCPRIAHLVNLVKLDPMLCAKSVQLHMRAIDRLRGEGTADSKSAEI